MLILERTLIKILQKNDVTFRKIHVETSWVAVDQERPPSRKAASLAHSLLSGAWKSAVSELAATDAITRENMEWRVETDNADMEWLAAAGMRWKFADIRLLLSFLFYAVILRLCIFNEWPLVLSIDRLNSSKSILYLYTWQVKMAVRSRLLWQLLVLDRTDPKKCRIVTLKW